MRLSVYDRVSEPRSACPGLAVKDTGAAGNEIVLLRHQLNALRRRVPSKPKLAVADRLLFVSLYRLFPSVLNAVAIVQPETIIRWHRAGFRLYWR